MERLAKHLKDIQGAREEDVVKIAEFDVSTEAAVCVCVCVGGGGGGGERMVNISREAALTVEGVNQLEHGLTDWHFELWKKWASHFGLLQEKSKVFKYAKWPSKWLTSESLVWDLMK